MKQPRKLVPMLQPLSLIRLEDLPIYRLGKPGITQIQQKAAGMADGLRTAKPTRVMTAAATAHSELTFLAMAAWKNDERLPGGIIKRAFYLDLPNEIGADGMAKIEDGILIGGRGEIMGFRGIAADPDALNPQSLHQGDHCPIAAAQKPPLIINHRPISKLNPEKSLGMAVVWA